MDKNRLDKKEKFNIVAYSKAYHNLEKARKRYLDAKKEMYKQDLIYFKYLAIINKDDKEGRKNAKNWINLIEKKLKNVNNEC